MRPGVSADCPSDGAELIAAREGRSDVKSRPLSSPSANPSSAPGDYRCRRSAGVPPGRQSSSLCAGAAREARRLPSGSGSAGAPRCEKFPLCPSWSVTNRSRSRLECMWSINQGQIDEVISTLQWQVFTNVFIYLNIHLGPEALESIC